MRNWFLWAFLSRYPRSDMPHGAKEGYDQEMQRKTILWLTVIGAASALVAAVFSVIAAV